MARSVDGCVFCRAATGRTTRSSSTAAPRAFVILNLYPYNNGHVMVVPRRHVASLGDATADELAELFTLMRDAERALTAAYAPHGINVGLNLGRAAGAGVADHLHVHLVPRWTGDTNFMTIVADAARPARDPRADGGAAAAALRDRRGRRWSTSGTRPGV